jgi:RimJ/RimL family protein N-acetyltransferase
MIAFLPLAVCLILASQSVQASFDLPLLKADKVALSELPVRIDQNHILARLETKHLSEVLEILHHPDVLETSGFPVLSDKAIQFWIDESTPVYRLPLNWTILEPKFLSRGIFNDGKLVGIVLFEAVNRSGVANLIYAFHPSVWGQGVALPAVRLFVSMGFKRFGLNRIESLALRSNTRSIRLLGKLAFQQYGERRNYRGGTESLFALGGSDIYPESRCHSLSF